MYWMTLPLKRYADFEGRSRRQEYWMFYLFNLLCSFAIAALAGIFLLVTYSMGLSEEAMTWAMIPVFLIALAWSLVLFIPQLAVMVRRMHDQDKSGWMILLGLIPLAGGIILLVFMCLEGTRGPNRFGPDPKAENIGATFA